MSSSVLAAILIPIAVAMALATWIFFALSSRSHLEPSSRPRPDSGYGTARPAEDDRKVSAPAARDEPVTPTRRDTVRPAATPLAAATDQQQPAPAIPLTGDHRPG